MEKIKVGVIGVGYLGRFHAEKYAAMTDVELSGVVDLVNEQAEAVARQVKTTAYNDYRQLIDRVDAVSIVVPTTGHYQVAVDAMNAGCDVLIEKPITTTLAEADALIALAGEKGRILQVGHLERFNPAVLAMHRHITRPLFIESHRIHMFKPRGLDVDVVLDLMIHDIDIIMNLVQAPISHIHTVGLPVVTPTTDIANARIMFENGCTANVTVSRISKDTIRRIRVFQPRSFVSVDYGNKEITVIELGRERGADGFPTEQISRSTFPDQDSLALELTDFIANVRHRTTPVVDGRAGRLALDIAHQIIAQIKEHRANLQDVL